MNILEIIWYVSLTVILGYHFFVFRTGNKRPSAHQWPVLPGVSMVIAVKNGSDSLARHFKDFLSQEYPLYEIIIVNDYSTPEERKKLEEMVHGLAQVTLYHSTDQPGKKQALSMGIEKAEYKFILCTDADCFPASPAWIKSMMGQAGEEKFVLGYSPYVYSKGLLNLIVRFETVMTAIQYFSWAMMGKPYMGVGRNMLYPRQLFKQVDPYRDHQHIPYGDDDLWVQQASPLAEVSVNFDKASHVFSAPPVSWRAWFKQKHRHFSAGHHYRRGSWWQPGLYGMALIGHWMILVLFVSHDVDKWMAVFFLLGLSVRWDTYRKWTARLGERDTSLWYPVLEVVYALYLAGMGVITIMAKKKTWN